MNGSIHDNTIDWLVGRLTRTGRYKNIDACLDYSSKGLNGEFDVLAVLGERRWNYYEVKSFDNKKARLRAAYQFYRAEKAFPKVDFKFIFVTPQGITRYSTRRGFYDQH